jgi:ferredoxin
VRISVEADKCVASGHCVLAAPEVFDQNEDDGVVIVLNDEPSPDQHDAVREAAILCPAAVIRLIEAEKLPPTSR